jgi:choline dehydrogenase-like flavoprotein
MSIVDSRLRVHGFDELRVADAFVSEDYERQHLASSIVIGELAASFIIGGF